MKEIRQFLKSKGFPEKTQGHYISVIKRALNNLGDTFTNSDIEEYLTYLNISPRTYNNYRTVLNFYCKRYKGFELTFEKSKVPKSIPTYVTYPEFNKVLSVTSNFKHKLIFALMYGSGLRVGEVVRLKKHNIYLNHQIIFVKKGKGQKDRHTIIPSSILNNLELYVKSLPEEQDYLFKTYNGHLSERSVEERLIKARQDAKLTKHFTPHDLRHSFASNLVNKGVHIKRIRDLLGHSSIRSTEIYLQCDFTDVEAIAKIA